MEDLIASIDQRLSNQLWSNVGAQSTFDAIELARKTNLASNLVEQILQAFEFPFQRVDSIDKLGMLRSDPAPLRLRPLLRDNNGIRFLTQGFLRHSRSS